MWTPAQIEQDMRAELGAVLGDMLRQTGGAYETMTRLMPKFREDLGPSGVTAAVGTMRDGGLSVEF